MILLSRVIKAPFARHEGNEKKLIQIKNYVSVHKETQTEHNDIAEAAKQAQAIVQEAQHEAELLKKEAQHYYETLKQQIMQEKEQWEHEKRQLIELAQKEGYEIGLQQGKNDGLTQYLQHIERAKQLVELANNEFYKQIEAANETIFLIGLKVAERILGKQLDDNREHFVSLVKRAIREVREHSEVKVYVHPTYYDTVVSQKDELKAIFNREVDLFIYPDDQLSEHGCFIESPFGRIDASVDTQLHQIKEKLRERFEHLEEE
jgi:flagellar assembly protein FliH